MQTYHQPYWESTRAVPWKADSSMSQVKLSHERASLQHSLNTVLKQLLRRRSEQQENMDLKGIRLQTSVLWAAERASGQSLPQLTTSLLRFANTYTYVLLYDRLCLKCKVWSHFASCVVHVPIQLHCTEHFCQGGGEYMLVLPHVRRSGV